MFVESAEFYDAIYSFKDYAAESEQIAALIRAAQPAALTVLDIACGTGEHVRLLSTKHGFDVDGLDINSELLTVARTKNPTGHFYKADMSDFSLGHTYDAIVCLFSSIGYLTSLEQVERALVCFQEHLAPGGVVLVEPWFSPGMLDTSRVSKNTATYQGRSVIRTSRITVEGRLSRIHFSYEIETPEGIRQATEVHELALYTPKEMGAAFWSAGFVANFDPKGPTGRGLWTATRVNS
ncbi:MAG: class I SAM-dependent methyltransferase [Armatimonas sp.]